MAKITMIRAREILDSRGNPTVEVDLSFESQPSVRAAVPSGASTGAYEAHELRDNDSKRYKGKGVLTAVHNISEKLASALVGKSFSRQSELDAALIELDGTENKSNLGANALLGISMAFTKALAQTNDQWVYESLRTADEFKLPVPLMNILNGGAHANNGLDVQEFMIAPVRGASFREALRAGSEIFHTLKSLLNSKGLSTAVGDEGGFAPVLSSNKEALDLIMQAIEKAGYRPGEDVRLALDVAATELFKDEKYDWEGERLTGKELSDVYAEWARNYPIASIEDGFSEDDWESWKSMTASHGQSLQLVGDDLFVTNPKRLKKGIDEKAANALLVKVNQIGTITETQKAVSLASSHGFHTVMSHRSGETEDTLIADLAVALNCQQIKTGSLCRGERIAKYNQLLRIEERLKGHSEFWGKQAF
ncbi:MAG: phosphopyruvate hydratase [Pseudobdellovibrionaceae bacterium]|nr:MAG: phosphopyruvate hydratase [Pseudobdellovibrionaceae bacterium]